MIRITTRVLVAVAMLAAFNVFAGDKTCCAKGSSKANSTANSIVCLNLATLNLTPDQKAKIETSQAKCMKTGCTKKSRQTFLTQAKRILSPEQFAQLKAQCEKTANARKTET